MPMRVEQVMASTMEPDEKDMGKSEMKALNSTPMPAESSTPVTPPMTHMSTASMRNC